MSDCTHLAMKPEASSAVSRRSPWVKPAALFLLVLPILFGGTAAYASSPVAHFSGVQTAIGIGPSSPAGVAVDSNENVYVADPSDGLVKELLAAGGYATINTLGGGFLQPQGLAVDASGNVFVGDFGGGIKEIPIGCITGNNNAGCVVTLASSSTFPDAQGLAVDTAGNVYIADPDYGSVQQLLVSESYAIPHTIGSGFSNIQGVAVDASGNIYVTNFNGVEEILAVGGYTTINVLDAGDGGLTGIAVDANGNVFFTDINLITAQEIEAVGGSIPASPTIVSVGAAIGSSEGIVVDSHENIFIGGSSIWEIQLGSVNFGAITVPNASAVSTLLFTFDTGGSINPPSVLPSVAPLGASAPEFVDVNDGDTCVTGGPFTTGQTCTVDVVFTPAYPGQRIGAVQLQDTNVPPDLLATANIYGTGLAPQAAFTPGVINTIAGVSPPCSIGPTPPFCGDGGPATSAQLNEPEDAVPDTAGDIYIADSGDNLIREVSIATGIINTVAGGGAGTCGTAVDALGDGCPATDATFNTPESVALDGAGDIYIADYGNNLIREVNTAGIITAVVGNGAFCIPGGSAPFCGDGGPATSAQLGEPAAAAVDAAGNIYIADFSDQLVRKVTAATGIITTVAGNNTFCSIGASPPFCGDGGLATSAQLNSPSSVTVDSAGDIYIADEGDNLVREVSAATGIITTIAGNGTACTDFATPPFPPPPNCGDTGPATSAALNSPSTVALDAAGNLYIADFNDNLVRKVDTSGTITTIAGNNSGTIVNGSPATSVSFSGVAAVTLDAAGNLYIADINDALVREVTVGTAASLIFNTGTPLGTLDTTDVPLPSFVLYNTGDTGLTFPGGGGTGAGAVNPVIDADFAVDTGNTNLCNLGTGSADYLLNPGANCTYAFDFTPLSTGSISGNVTIADNSLNIAGVQNINLQGTGTPGNPVFGTMSFTSNSVSVTSLPYGTNQDLIISDTLSYDPLATVTPGGAVTYTLNGVAYTANCVVTVAGTLTCTADAPASDVELLPVSGSVYSVAAAYTADTNYNAATGTSGSFSITAVTPVLGTITFQSPLNTTVTSVPYGSNQDIIIFDTLSYAGSGALPSGAVTLTLNGTGYVATCSGSSSPLTCSVDLTAPVVASLTANTYTVTAAYTTDTNYTAATDNTGSTLTIGKGTPSFGTITFQSPLNTPVSSLPYGTSQDVFMVAALSYGGSVAPTGTATLTLNGVPYTATCSGSATPLTCTADVPASDVEFLTAANYAGTAAITTDTNYFAATGNTSDFLTIAQQAPALGTISFSPASSEYFGTNQDITLSDTLNYTGSGLAPTGAFTYLLNGQSYTASCSGGSGTLTCTATVSGSVIAALPVAAYTATAAYAGDTNYTLAADNTGSTFTILQDVFIVDTSSDSVGSPDCTTNHAANSCSLREALNEAGAISSAIPVTVNFNPAASGFGSLGVSAINITNGGSGYSSAPNVSISGGGGSGATATATLNLFGIVASVTVTNPGSGYSSAPTVTIDPPTSGTTATAAASLSYVILLSSGPLTVPTNTTVQGSTSGSGTTLKNLITVNGDSGHAVFTISNSTDTNIFLNNLNITNGNNSSGGGIVNNGSLAIQQSSIYSNTTSVSAAGIYNTGTGTLTLNDSTVSDNTSTNGGSGGIGSDGTLTLNYSTISGNSATANGGGLVLGGPATINNSTISGNTAGGAGGAEVLNTLTLNNSIIEGNTAASSAVDIFPNVVFPGSGSVYDTDGGTTFHDPGLSALGSYGGPTLTLLALPGGVSICAGLTAALPGGFTTDQRGDAQSTTYSSNTCVDAGSTQSNYSLAFVQQPSNAAGNTNIAPAPTVQLSESTSSAAFAGVSIAAAFTNHPAFTAGTTSAVTSSTGLATFSNLQGNAVDTSETITASVAAGSNTITVVSGTFNVTKAAQTITFTAPAGTPDLVTYGVSPIQLTATGGGSGNAVTFTVDGSSTAGIATINGSNQVVVTGAGSIVIDANQLGNTNYLAATQVQTTITVGQATPTFGTMGFSPAASEVYGTNVAVTISDMLIYTGASAPTGAVTYTLNSVAYTASCSGGSSPLTCTAIVPAATIAALPGSAYTVTPAYTADTNYAANNGAGATGTFTITEPAEAIWVVNSTGSLSELFADGSAQCACNTAAITGSSVAVVFDGSGNIWSASSTGVVEYNAAGSLLSTVTGGGISSPAALAVDGGGNIWTANGNGSVSEIHSGSAITPSGGYVGGGMNGSNGIAIDTSGNVWVSNGGNNSMTEIVGGAPPTQPLATATENNTLGGPQ